MSRRHKRPVHHKKPGTAPGTLVLDPEAPHPSLSATVYGPEGVRDIALAGADEIKPLLGGSSVVWVNVDGLGDEATLREIAEVFDLHRLALEDVVNVHQRPKAEAYDSDLFVIANMPAGDATEQVSFFLGEGYLLTFQERQGDCFDGVRARIRNERSVLRRSGPDYLFYTLLDSVIDSYFPVVEVSHDRLEELEEEVLTSDKASVSEIHAIKRRLQELRRVIGPHREVVNTLLRDGTGLITAETGIYLRDCYDHVLRLTERVEIYREQCTDLLNTYLSMVSNRMNEVMKVLTIFATIFMPLGFIAGLYGMNFNPEVSRWNMPELSLVFGYPMALGLMAVTAIGLVIYFKRKRWL